MSYFFYIVAAVLSVLDIVGLATISWWLILLIGAIPFLFNMVVIFFVGAAFINANNKGK